MKSLAILLLSFVLVACGEPSQSTATRKSESIFVLIENGGTVAESDRDAAMNTVLHLFQQISTLERRKATRYAQVHVVLSASPNRIAWSGTPSQLLAQAEDVKNLVVFKPSFSDLVMAFEQIETTINLTQPGAIRLYWIGPTVHVPFQSSGDKIEVSVPQEIPSNLALPRFADRLSVLKIIRVHPDQDQVLQAYLASLGILKRARSGSLEFSLLGDAQTKSTLKALL
ncbi:MAG: hypothetical protein KME56_12405 [Candidatus Thiodiazotropha sp. (ex Ctena orbiculata)]|nr:hypothetical protein [Candidatus Thiodiazotropha taylori]MBT2997422.1 hypothetical protein [Candidatus Thiodiazotropha taylori]MBT3001096.1 hypothetical protein [Candidatus Thiodiazotropha taylori]MBV2107500.1 hypothetical protein [Candidatus Thiodiazotropha taylori]MBV2111943.1 hypothetical protein [Candidatus Thiodiazotropha taylori]